ncbi:EcsC family protein [Pseudomonas moorei]|uniref:EcsC family protein n=1 Tax=Pseudomonas moorei TaxID=395599 RepID=UPI001FF6AA1B|nr:EcsC family protein [Pseudomonas moorei]
MSEEKEDNGSALMKIVEAIAITPKDARELVTQYQEQARKAKPDASSEQIQALVTDKIIERYSKMAAATGGATSLAGVIPGIGTAVAMVGGGAADVSMCMKLQIDMTMCLGIAINKKMSNEDAKHMSFVIALCGSLEQMTSSGATKVASKAAVRVVSEYLKGATLQTIKQLFKQVGINFTKAAATKAIPFGVGLVIGTAANYALTRYVGSVARDVFLLHVEDADSSAAIAQP